MSNQAFLIVFDRIDEHSSKEELIETIRSLYVSKLANSNSYAIIAKKDSSCQDIYNSIFSKLDSKTNFIVIEMGAFYGNLTPDCVNWLKEQFPESNWLA